MATTPSDPENGPPTGVVPTLADRRLHPFSWLFVLLTQLRLIAIPAVLWWFGRGQTWELFGAVFAVGLALYALVYSIGFRYRIGRGELLVREGIFNRTERHIPFGRIQNIVQKRNLLHRLFGVTELRLESAGGTKPEAVMRVIRLAAAGELERVLRRGGLPVESDATATLAMDESDGAEDGDGLFAVTAADLLRLGLISNRGMVVLGGLLAAIAGVVGGAMPWEWWRGFQVIYSWSMGHAGAWVDGAGSPLLMTLVVILMIVAAIVVLRLLSIVMAFLQFHDFRLRESDGRLSCAAGLLTHTRASALKDKLQRLDWHDSWLHRWFQRASLSVEVAVAQIPGDDAQPRLDWLVPIGTPAQVSDVIRAVQPEADFSAMTWLHLPARALRRMLVIPSLFVLFVTAQLVWWFGPLGLIALTALPWLWWQARGWLRFSAYAVSDDVIAFRAGWLNRTWSVVRIEKIQVLKLSRSPFDRRAGMANVSVDTAGSKMVGGALEIPYLLEVDARALFARLHAGIVRHDGNARAEPRAFPLDVSVST